MADQEVKRCYRDNDKRAVSVGKILTYEVVRAFGFRLRIQDHH